MADRPIIFSAPMVSALLAGRKTQTRRIMNLPPAPAKLGGWEASTIGGVGVTDQRGRPVPERSCVWHTRTGEVVMPRFSPGDRLYVREAWSHSGVGVWTIEQARMSAHTNGRPIYRATDKVDAGTKFWPSIHMPREFSRLTLHVEGVKVERLQDIREADALAEGVDKLIWDGEAGWHQDDVRGTFRCGFAGIWQHLHGADSWDSNPFVVALTFRVEHGNIDRLAHPQGPTHE